MPIPPPGATSSCAAATPPRATISRSSSTTRCRAVSDIARGRDLFAATSAHRLLQALLGLPAPRYRHHRLVLDANGDKMSKSAASTPLRALRAQGATTEDVRVALGFAPGAPRFAARLS